MFEVGDKIVYPMHGAGIITSIERKEILGEESEYFIINMPLGNIKISVPVHRISEMGIRDVLNKEDIQSLLEILEKDSEEMISNWNRRYRENLDRLKSGNLFEVAVVVRDLTILDREKGLSTGEKKMLNNAKRMMISEIVVVTGSEPEEIEDKIEDLILEPR